MTISRLPSSRYRATVHVRGRGNVSASTVLGLPATSYRTQKEARAAEAQARAVVADQPAHVVTVGAWYRTWTGDALWTAHKKASTNILNAERCSHFVRAHEDLPLAHLSDMHAAAWLSGGRRNGQIDKLRAMFNDAASAKAGRLLARNPFAGLRVGKGRGNADKQPPSEEMVWALIAAARRLTSPSFAAWLQVAAFTGMRPGELDALRWSAVDLDRGRISVLEQFSAVSRSYTLPKNNRRREALLTPPARDALVSLPRVGDFCFLNLRDRPMTPSARAYHWKAVRAAVGYEDTLYLATRHFFGAYATNVLRMTPEDVAIALGHTDGGLLVRQRYGHLNTDDALARVASAFDGRSNVVPLRRKDAG